MPTFYNFRNKNDYMSLYWQNVSNSAQRLRLHATQPNYLDRLCTTSIVNLSSPFLSPGKENQALRITPTGTNEGWEAVNLNSAPFPNTGKLDYAGTSARTYRATFSYRASASAIGKSFKAGVMYGPLGGAGFLATTTTFTITDTNWTRGTASHTKNISDTFRDWVYFGSFNAILVATWTPSDWIDIADFELTWDEQPVTTTSFDDQFIPADTFRQGNLFGWGKNEFSAQGIFTSGIGVPYDGSSNKSSPIAVGSYSKWKTLGTGSGGSQRYAIDSNGNLWFWGLSNSAPIAWPVLTSSQLRVTFSTPAFISATGTWKDVSRHGITISGGGIAVKTDGTLWTWGLNSYGQLGNNTTINTQTLIQEITSSSNWKQVSGGEHFVSAIKTDGTLWCWGRNTRGQLGTNDNISRSTPVQEWSSSTNWRQVSCSRTYVTAIKNDGTMWMWGSTDSGTSRLPYVDAGNFARSTPAREQLLRTDWKSVDCSYETSLGSNSGVALTNSGSAYRFGAFPVVNNGGGDTVSIQLFATEPNKVWKKASLMDLAYYLIDSSSNLWAVGNNSNGQLGVGDGIFRPTPVQVTNQGGWKEVRSGSFSDNIVHAIRYIDPII